MKTPNPAHIYSRFVGEANVLWPEMQMALIEQSFGYKTTRLSLDQSVPRARNRNQALQFGPSRLQLTPSISYTYHPMNDGLVQPASSTPLLWPLNSI
jgi:hypothetical protein